MTTALTTIGPLQEALALATEAGDIDTLRDIAATATALQKGAKARGMGLEAENTAAEVILRAERAIGRSILAMRAEGQLAARGASPSQWTSRDATSVKTLADIGLGSGTDRNRVAEWQRLAEVPDAEFEARFGTIRDSGARIAKVDFYRLVKGKPERKPEAEQDMHGDGLSAAMQTFERACRAIIANIPTLPTDELTMLATDIRELADAYSAERARR